MAITVISKTSGYDNKVIEDAFESNLLTALDFNQFCVVDNSLQSVDGLTKTINTYTATSGNVEVLAEGQGNTKSTTVSFTDKDYTVQCYQGQFAIYDEAVMKDSNLYDVALKGLTEDFTNQITTDVIGEMNKATKTATVDGSYADAVAQAIAELPYDSQPTDLYLVVSKATGLEIQKEAKEYLKYVEAFMRSGYIGSIYGVPIYTTKATLTPLGVLGQRDAITVFTKKGVESETERDANLRKTTHIMRKYGLTALTDNRKIVKLVAKSNG